MPLNKETKPIAYSLKDYYFQIMKEIEEKIGKIIKAAKKKHPRYIKLKSVSVNLAHST